MRTLHAHEHRQALVATAKWPETRRRRVDQTVALGAANVRARG